MVLSPYGISSLGKMLSATRGGSAIGTGIDCYRSGNRAFADFPVGVQGGGIAGLLGVVPAAVGAGPPFVDDAEAALLAVGLRLDAGSFVV